MASPEPPKSPPQLRASQLVKDPSVWAGPAILVTLLVFVMTLVYFGSVVDPPGHLHGLRVSIVDEDAGATVGSRRVDFGRQVAEGLTRSPAVSSRLSLRAATLSEADARMDVGKDYAAVVIPPGFTASLLAVSGVPVPAARVSSKPTVELLTNPRAGTLGVSLATGGLQP